MYICSCTRAVYVLRTLVLTMMDLPLAANGELADEGHRGAYY